MREANAAVVSVRDTGIGIPPDRLGEAFEMFSQIHPSTFRTDAGLGIGLALVKRLVEMHKGKVEARSKGLGWGAEFVVKLPLISEMTQAAHADIDTASKKQPEFRLPPRRILVVDDNEDTAESMATLLELSGNQVQCAGDGLAALKAVDRFGPQIMLLDIGLPNMNGYQFCRAIRRKPRDTPTSRGCPDGMGTKQRPRREQAGRIRPSPGEAGIVPGVARADDQAQPGERGRIERSLISIPPLIELRRGLVSSQEFRIPNLCGWSPD